MNVHVYTLDMPICVPRPPPALRVCSLNGLYESVTARLCVYVCIYVEDLCVYVCGYVWVIDLKYVSESMRVIVVECLVADSSLWTLVLHLANVIAKLYLLISRLHTNAILCF